MGSWVLFLDGVEHCDNVLSMSLPSLFADFEVRNATEKNPYSPP
ncbi:hypothetical protein [Pyrobaculum islandicum]|nr:hypothetical protein [Pyrobaculum islandicum]